MEKLVIKFVNLFSLPCFYRLLLYHFFFSERKVRPLKYLEKDETMQEVFGSMGFDEKVSEKTFSIVEHCLYRIWKIKVKVAPRVELTEVFRKG